MLSAFLPDAIVNPDKKPGAELTSAVSPKQVTEATSDVQGQTTLEVERRASALAVDGTLGKGFMN